MSASPRANRRCRSGRSGTCVSDSSGSSSRSRCRMRTSSRIFQTLGANDRRDADPVGRGAAHGSAGAAHHRLLLGPHLEPARPAAPVFPRGRRARIARADRDAALTGVVGGRGTAVDPRRQHQHRDGAVPRVRRRSAAASAARRGLFDAELLHRRGRRGRGHAAVDLRAGGSEQRGHGKRRGGDSRHGAIFVRHRRGRCSRARCCGPSSRRASIRPAELHGFADATPLAEGVEPGSAANAARTRRVVAGRGRRWARCSCGISRGAPQLYMLCGLFGALGRGAAGQRRARGRRHVRDADARHRQHAAAHAAAHARAVLLVARVVRDVAVHERRP